MKCFIYNRKIPNVQMNTKYGLMKFVFHKSALVIFLVSLRSWPGPCQKVLDQNFGIEFLSRFLLLSASQELLFQLHNFEYIGDIWPDIFRVFQKSDPNYFQDFSRSVLESWNRHNNWDLVSQQFLEILGNLAGHHHWTKRFETSCLKFLHSDSPMMSDFWWAGGIGRLWFFFAFLLAWTIT